MDSSSRSKDIPQLVWDATSQHILLFLFYCSSVMLFHGAQTKKRQKQSVITFNTTMMVESFQWFQMKMRAAAFSLFVCVLVS